MKASDAPLLRFLALNAGLAAALPLGLPGCGGSTSLGQHSLTGGAGGGTALGTGGASSAGGTTANAGGASGAGGTVASTGGKSGGGGTTAGAGGASGAGGTTAGTNGASGGRSGAGGAQASGGTAGRDAGLGDGGTLGMDGGRGAGGDRLMDAGQSAGGARGSGGAAGAGGLDDAGLDAQLGCPAQRPAAGTACSGGLSCTYGQATCCGRSYPGWTCTCQSGTFTCTPFIECNIMCPADAGLDAAIDVSSDVAGSTADAGSAACGAAGDPACASGSYCDWPDNRCGSGVEGTCATIPGGVLCAISTVPVCGCDGQNYSGICYAIKAGVDVSSTANCPEPTGMFRCGWSYCQKQSQYCSAQVGGAISNPGSYACNALPAACGGVASCACVTVGSGAICSTSAAGDVTVTLEVP